MAYRRGGPLIVNSKCFALASHMTFYAVWPIAWLVDFILYRTFRDVKKFVIVFMRMYLRRRRANVKIDIFLRVQKIRRF